MVRLGGWLFRHRTALPQPLALAIVLIPASEDWGPGVVVAGVSITVAGEIIRLWAVHHIGTISRTRSDRVGPLIDDGPFAIVRNPLYLGNIALWVGFALTAKLVWLAPLAALLLGLEYHAIVRWEEALLEARLGEAYRAYARHVPRWLPRARPSAFAKATADRRSAEREGWSTSSGRAEIANAPSGADPLMASLSNHEPFSWPDTLFSERGTFIAIAAGYVLLWLKLRS
jgi:protein-S-isoprenylcysteine O-methyltransferase Ste14